ncbi:MAG: superoxide dismutase [Nitrospirae bacterium GWC2_42_7]|nr:MAG: superoxide dismutase [Nitrospirae bacterium GWC2_42_7]
MKKRFYQLIVVIIFLAVIGGSALAHCEIPCGIYDDEARITMLFENITTIEKSMNQIIALEKEQNHNSNQLIRWVMNKEDHANKLNEIVTQYFMAQRIKLDAKDYDKKIGLLHQMLVYSMKCKQTTDTKNTDKLRSLVKEFKEVYFDKK